MSNVQVSAAHIASLNVMQVVKDDMVRQQFVRIAGTLWPDQDAEATYEREAIYFNRLLADSQNLKNCTAVSIFIAFIDLAVCGLSLEPGVRALAYLQPRGYKTGAKDQSGKDIYEQRCTLTISGYGELIQRERAGQIRHADNPVVVYEGDGFTFSDQDGRKSVNYTLNINHDTTKPVACFLRITRADGSVDYSVMLREDWQRLAAYSGKANKKWDANTRTMVERPNELYQSGEGGRIDTGFLMAKCIKHAFKTYPKVRIGKGTTYEADEPQPRQEEDLYGLGAGETVDRETGEVRPAESEQSFDPGADTSAGVTVDPSANANDDDETF